jgi:N4-gp56 family major capsid protein
MAVNYATQYASEALDAFRIASVTEDVFSAKYSWKGSKTVSVFSNATATMNDYTRTGSARYGTMENLGNTVDALEVDKERSFTGAIDGLDQDDTGGTLAAGAFLAQQINRVVGPDVDGYRFAALFDACPTGQISTGVATTSATAYTNFLTASAALDEALVPKSGRVVFMTPAYLNLLKLDANYTKASDLAQSQLMFGGQVGMIDGTPVVMAPDAIVNGTVDHHIDFILVHKDAVAAPIKLADYKVTQDPPGIHGTLIEGLVVHDCFLLDALNDGIYIRKHA